MNIDFNASSGLSIHGEWIGLVSILPVLNGSILHESNVKRLVQGENAFALQYTAPEQFKGWFLLEIVPEGQEMCRLRFHVKDYPGKLDAFGINIAEIHNLKAYLCNGLTGWDESTYEEPENKLGFHSSDSQVVTGHGMTQLIPRFGVGSMVIGFNRHDRYQQLFSFIETKIPVSMTIETYWDQKQTLPGSICSSDWLVFFDHKKIEEALLEWAKMVARSCPIPPRIPLKPISGWRSSKEKMVSESIVMDRLENFNQWYQKSDASNLVFQIDGGFTPEAGDWLEIKDNFPKGIKPLMTDIKKKGFIPGLNIAPIMVGNQSHLNQQHPDWILRNRNTGEALIQQKTGAIKDSTERSDQFYILDTTHPQAFEYLRTVFRTWKLDWGCDYFQTDFYHFGQYGISDQIAYYVPGKTRIEIWRDLAIMIRQEIGDSTWLACGCPLWASVGLVDAVRFGNDERIDLWDPRIIHNRTAWNFTNHILWQNDPGCIYLRKKTQDQKEGEMESRAIMAGMTGGVFQTCEDFGSLDESNLSIWRLCLTGKAQKARLPFLGVNHVVYHPKIDDGKGEKLGRLISEYLDPVIVQVRDGITQDGLHAVFLMNTGQQTVQRSIPLESIGYQGPLHVYEWGKTTSDAHSQWQVRATLKPHQGILFFLSKQSLSELPNVLP